MYYKNSTKSLIASIALLSQLVYTVNPFVYAFFYYSMSQRALAQETQVTETSSETPSSSETEETASTASEEVNSENSEDQANTQEEPVVSVASEAEVTNSVEETEISETELDIVDQVQDELSNSNANEELVVETTSETEPNTAPTSENEPKVEGEILGEGASSVRAEAEPSDVIEEKEQVNGMECINSDTEIVSSTEEMWDLDYKNDTATTRDNVKAGVKYEFPLNKDVSLTFTCLPKNIEDRFPLKIKQLKLSDINLPNNINAVGEYAYDLTTDMRNGEFEYDLTLPKPENTAGSVHYIERSEDYVKSNDVLNDEVKVVDDSQIEQIFDNDSIAVSDLDHFTIVFVSATLAVASLNNQTQVTVDPSTVIEAKLTVTTSGSGNSDDWRSSSWQIGSGTINCVNTDDHTSDGTYTEEFNITAPASEGNYNITFRAYNNNSCSGGGSTVATRTLTNGIIVSNSFVTNPPLPQACGLDIALILDNSTSIDFGELSQMKSAVNGFVTALSGTPTQFSVTRFGTTASISQSFTGNFSNITTAINNIPVSGGYTNWEDGLLKGQSTFDPRSNPNLVIFASDGNPNRVGTSGTESSESNAVFAAEVVANALKATGTRILVLGIGSGLDTGNLQAISGPNMNTGNVLTSDVITTDFSTLANQLSLFAQQTCGGTVTVTKKIDADGNLNTTNDQVVSSGWTFNVGGQNNKITDANGKTPAVNLSAGSNYFVTEIAQPGFSLLNAYCTGAQNNGSLNGNSVSGIQISNTNIVSCTFINMENSGSITIIKDAQPDSSQDFSFITTGAGLSNFTLDDDNDNTLLNTKIFQNVLEGTYSISESTLAGWSLSNISCRDNVSQNSVGSINGSTVSLNLSEGQHITCTFTNTQRGSISGTKYEYLGEEVESNTLGDWTINLYGSDWGLLTSTTTSNVDGSYQFANLVPGDYYICENNPEGWKQLTPSTGSIRPETTQICHSVSVEAGETVVEQDFENAKLSDVHGYKWEDLDQDGYRDICEFREGRIAQLDEECVPEPLLSGWRIFIDENKDGIYQPGNDETPGEPSMLTDDSEEHLGWYWFEDLMPGEYQICEVLESEWIQTYPYQSTEAYCHTVNLPDDTSEQTLNAVLAPEYNFGNYHELPTLLISKFNNKTGDELRIGDEITYTIQVTVEEATAGNVKVTDLLPQGVEYKVSSWTATSTVRGDISGLGEPTYNSPGVWTLGDMIPEEIVTLTYTGIVENGTDDGIYKDLAWAKATEQNILALAEEDGNKIATNFVGTEIEVVSDPVEEDLKVDIGEDEKIEEVGEVLGASTSLPATGSATVLLIALLFGLIGGLGMFIYSRNVSRNKKLVLGLVMLMATMLSANPAYAAEGDNLYVRLEEPNASQTTNFDVSFVALDSNNDPIEIVCWKKGPSDGAFVTFGSPILLNNGGDTGVCSVTGSVLTSDGDYKFKVSAETQTANPLDSVTKESEEVSVSYDGTKPGKPFDIEKERDNSCQFELSFKTANDGQTSYVEIYRDDEREFTASPSKLHKTIVIGPDSSYTFEDDLYGSECGKTFYYGIRAFDSLGNGSELGEEEDTEKTIKVTKTSTETKEETGAILSSGGSVSSDAGDNSSEVVLPGDILGESNTASDGDSNDGAFGTAFDGILGSLKNPKILLTIIAALLLLGYGIYRARKNR